FQAKDSITNNMNTVHIVIVSLISRHGLSLPKGIVLADSPPKQRANRTTKRCGFDNVPDERPYRPDHTVVVNVDVAPIAENRHRGHDINVVPPYNISRGILQARLHLPRYERGSGDLVDYL